MRLPWWALLAGYSLVSGVSVCTLYLPQALLPLIVADLGVTVASAGLLVMTVQLGYACGLFLIVPLADDRAMPRRSQWQLTLLSAALVVAALQYRLPGLFAAFFLLGLVATVGQSVIAVAHAESPPGKSAQSVAAITAMMLAGMFGGRIVAGFLAESIGWRGVLVAAAVATALTIPVLHRVTVGRQAGGPIGQGYAQTLRATAQLVRSEPRLRQIAVAQFFVFAGFTSMWTVIALHLTRAPVDWSIAQANQFGAVGLLAGVVAPLLVVAGGRALPVAFVLMLSAPLLAAVCPTSIVGVAVSMFVLTLGNQVIHAVQQDRAMSVAPQHRAKSNALFMTIVFVGGSAGAAAGPLAYAVGGMAAAGVLASSCVATGGVWWWLRSRR